MEKITKQFSSIEQVTGQYLNNKTINNRSQTSNVSFEEVLRKTQLESTSELKFSKHASMRLSECRNRRTRKDGIARARAVLRLLPAA